MATMIRSGKAGDLAGRAAHNGSPEHDLSAVVVVPASLATLLGDTQGRGFLVEEDDAEVAQRGHDRRGVAYADAAGVFLEGDVQAPVEPALDPPVPASNLGKALGVGSDGVLIAHRINGHDALLEYKQLPQFRDGRDLVGPLLRPLWPQHQPVGARPGADHVERSQPVPLVPAEVFDGISAVGPTDHRADCLEHDVGQRVKLAALDPRVLQR